MPNTDTVSEWSRRWTRNPLGSARRGSNPLGVVRAALKNRYICSLIRYGPCPSLPLPPFAIPSDTAHALPILAPGPPGQHFNMLVTFLTFVPHFNILNLGTANELKGLNQNVQRLKCVPNVKM